LRGIGGYFELELNKGPEYHGQAIKLNSGRSSLEFILTVRSYKKVYLPYFTCDAVLKPIIRLRLKYEFYRIDENFYPTCKNIDIGDDECLIYTNYFGLNDNSVLSVVKSWKNVIIDNAQSFYSLPLEGVDTFYSPRKFFGVPDGGYLYCDKASLINLNLDQSFNRINHLVKRIDISVEEGYVDYLKNEIEIDNLTIGRMSNFTERILQSIQYKNIAVKRIKNFNYLHSVLNVKNDLKISQFEKQVPLSYPFLTTNNNLKMKLIENKVYTPSYWPNVKNWIGLDSVEYNYAQNILHLPIDQRLGEIEMNKILNLIL
jgi:hypothetical protein